MSEDKDTEEVIEELTPEEKEKKWKQQLKSFIIPVLRRATFRWPPRYAAEKAARVGRGEYLCAKCGAICKPKQFTLDHINPVVSVEKGFTDWNDFLERLFCPQEGYQILCPQCDLIKTSIEDSLRAEYHKQRKELAKQEKKLCKKIKRESTK